MRSDSYYDLKDEIMKGFDRMCDQTFYFYGVFDEFFKIDDMVLEVVADPDDGYRSYMGAVFHSLDQSVDKHFFDKPLGRVVLQESEHYETDDYGYGELFKGWLLVDVDTGHVWLRFGTDNCADYYPYFVFNYMPDQTQQKFVEVEEGYVPYKQRHPEIVISYPEWFSGERIEFD